MCLGFVWYVFGELFGGVFGMIWDAFESFGMCLECFGDVFGMSFGMFS